MSESEPHSTPAQSPPQPITTSVPKRKPVPTAEPQLSGAPEDTAAVQPPTNNDNNNTETAYRAADQEKGPAVEWQSQNTSNNGSQRHLPRKFAFAPPALSLAALDKVRLGPLDKYLPYERRKRRYIIAGILAGIAIAILALIIGLAAGLTAGKNKTQNLPLPTSNGGPYTGDLTYYAPALGACGITSSDSDSICAVSHIIFDAAQKGSDPNANPLCGLKIRLRRDDKSVDVTVVDRCVGCKATDIDTTTSVFGTLAEIDQGRVKVQWAWLESAPVNVTSS